MTDNSNTAQETLVCIVCPRGCRLTAHRTPEGPVISGNFCPRGAEYGVQELTAPVRVLTALMRPDGTDRPVSVKTDRPVPREKLFECAAAIYQAHPPLPIRRGDLLIRDLCGTGANVIATRDSRT